jgi:hypothetical protein
VSKHCLVVAAVAALAGCAAPEPPPPVAGAPVPLVKYDGDYQGRASLVSAQGGAQGSACPAGRYGVIEVADHTLNFAYLPDVVFVADVAADGTIHDTSGPAVLDGRIANGDLTMTVKTPQCQTSYSASVVWNHG